MPARILAATIAAALGVTGFGALAQPPTSGHARDDAQLAQLQSELAALQAKIATLERRQPVATPTPASPSRSRTA